MSKQSNLGAVSGVKRNRRLVYSSIVITTQDKKIWVTSDLHSKLHGIILGGAAVNTRMTRFGELDN